MSPAGSGLSRGVPVAARGLIVLRWVAQRGADIGDVEHPDQARFAGHRQVPDMPGHHGPGRVPDACRRIDHGRIRGYQGADPEVVDVLAVRHRLSDVSLGDDADGLLGLVVSTTTRAVTPACFIRYAAAATWSRGSIVAGAGRMTSAAVAGACGGRCTDGFWVKASVMIRSVSGEPRRDPLDPCPGLIAGAAGSRLPDDL